MNKDFITVTPDSGGGSGSLNVVATTNTGTARTSSITVSGSGATKTIIINQATEVEQNLQFVLNSFESRTGMSGAQQFRLQFLVQDSIEDTPDPTDPSTFTYVLNSGTTPPLPANFKFVKKPSKIKLTMIVLGNNLRYGGSVADAAGKTLDVYENDKLVGSGTIRANGATNSCTFQAIILNYEEFINNTKYDINYQIR